MIHDCMSTVFYSFRLGLYVCCCVNVVKHVLQYVQLNILALCSRMHYTLVSHPLWRSQENLRQFRKSFSGPLESRLVSSQEKYFQKFDPKSEYLGKSERSHFGCVGWNLAISGIWMPPGIVGSAKLGLRIPQKMGVGCNLQIPLTPDGTTSIKDYHRPFWPWVLLFPATVKTAEWHYRTEAIIHETQKHKPAATKWTHRRMRILNDICFGLWAVRANHNETVRHHALA